MDLMPFVMMAGKSKLTQQIFQNHVRINLVYWSHYQVDAN